MITAILRAVLVAAVVGGCPAILTVNGSGSTGTIASYQWDLSWTAASPDLVTASPSATFEVQEGTRGTITLTVSAADGQTASVTRGYPR